MADTLHYLTKVLETVAGEEEAEAFFSTVGSDVGHIIYNQYASQLEKECPNGEILPDVLIDLEKRVGGAFRLIEKDENRIVLENSACPFGEKVQGTRSVCMMTSNIFGHVTSNCKGYAKVNLEKTIARGDGLCRVSVSFNDDATPGLEYFADD
ncbi:methanogen output domain 1-containing protein [Thalassovita gelatinovora]|uniref:methanogen output domain 1-containing protein n=1 Tax=Thalassovita gelatinovora TaxID=53501 RepID=UPI00111374A1|nr:methanogen output domain 1-containing protein [Thalassovita gelatinovora]QIZ78989.1 transcriptional regulator [Thalassovita gelatinovora]